MTMEAVTYSLRQTVFGILKTLVVRASQNNLDLTYDVDPDIPDQLIGDSLRLRQVITNLVGNAIKFTPSKMSEKGHVALSTRLLALDDQSVTLEFCVLDTGIGIAKDKLNLIFDTFCQADGSTTRVCFTTYLLPICLHFLLRNTEARVWDYRFPSVLSPSCKAICGLRVSFREEASSSSPSRPRSAKATSRRRFRRCSRSTSAPSSSWIHYGIPRVSCSVSKNSVSSRMRRTIRRKSLIRNAAPTSTQ